FSFDESEGVDQGQVWIWLKTRTIRTSLCALSLPGLSMSGRANTRRLRHDHVAGIWEIVPSGYVTPEFRIGGNSSRTTRPECLDRRSAGSPTREICAILGSRMSRRCAAEDSQFLYRYFNNRG